MAYKIMKQLLFVTLFMVGCAEYSITNSITRTPFVEPEVASNTPTLANVAPMVTPSSLPSPMLATPSLDSSPIADNMLLANPPSNCTLPACWQGVTIRESDHNRVQQVFDDVFGFNGNIDFFSDNMSAYTHDNLAILGYWPLPSSSYATSYVWDYPKFTSREGNLEVLAEPSLFVLFWLDSQTNSVQGIGLDWLGDVGTLNTPTPVQIIQVMGAPDAAFVNFGYTKEFYEAAFVAVYMIYKDGLIYEHHNSASFSQPDATGGVIVTACLDQSGNNGSVFLVPPMTDIDFSSPSLTPLQNQFLQNIHRSSPVPIKQALDMTSDEFTGKIQQGTVCFNKYVH